MRHRNRYDQVEEDLQPTQQELDDEKLAASAQGTGAGIGTAAGTVVGGLAGAGIGLLPLLGGPTAVIAPETVIGGATLGANLGGTAGNLIGNSIGSWVGTEAEKRARAAALRRQRGKSDFDLHQSALDELLATR